VLDGGPDPPWEWATLRGERDARCKVSAMSSAKMAIWVVDSSGLKEAQVQPYSPGGAIVPTWEGTLAPPGEYDSTVCGGDAVLCQITLTTCETALQR